MATLLTADLHLSAERPEAIDRFLGLLAGPARQADALYILGDLFEAWIGDDCILDEYRPVIAALRALADAGVPAYVLPGNRDFLLGEAFAAASGCTLLADPTRIDLHGTPTLLLHGDTLCTDDAAYQQMRARFRDPAWVDAFLAQPVEERLAFARELRRTSREATAAKAETIMDVNPDAVAAAFRQHGVARLIHGHTHRPGHHMHTVDGTERDRYVLGAWHAGGDVLECDGGGCLRWEV